MAASGVTRARPLSKAWAMSRGRSRCRGGVVSQGGGGGLLGSIREYGAVVESLLEGGIWGVEIGGHDAGAGELSQAAFQALGGDAWKRADFGKGLVAIAKDDRLAGLHAAGDGAQIPSLLQEADPLVEMRVRVGFAHEDEVPAGEQNPAATPHSP